MKLAPVIRGRGRSLFYDLSTTMQAARQPTTAAAAIPSFPIPTFSRVALVVLRVIPDPYLPACLQKEAEKRRRRPCVVVLAKQLRRPVPQPLKTALALLMMPIGLGRMNRKVRPFLHPIRGPQLDHRYFGSSHRLPIVAMPRDYVLMAIKRAQPA
jgi:hypothetical protein